MQELASANNIFNDVALLGGTCAFAIAFWSASVFFLLVRYLAEAMKSPIHVHPLDADNCTSLVNKQLTSLVMVLY
jgi:hypothetical protein